MAQYAAKTEVAQEKSRAEIERTLVRYGATEFAYAWREQAAVLGFKCKGRFIRMMLPMPKKEDFARTPTTRVLRSAKAQQEAWDQGCRQRWRAMALYIKATLEAIESGIVTFETAFEPFTLLPNGLTVSEYVGPQIAAAYSTGQMPDLLPGMELLELGGRRGNGRD